MWNNKCYEDEQKGMFLKETNLYNEVVLGSLLPPAMWVELPHFIQTWIRNLISGSLVYLVPALLWSFLIYYWKPNLYIPQAMKAMPWYTLYLTVNEYVVESGSTKCFARVSDVGWPIYLVYLITYLTVVEFGIYWMHRELHHVKPLYKLLHSTHHIYNKQTTLSPFAGLAFHPLDGILQALPHSISLFIVPMQFRTHIALLFVEGLWTANVHDCIHGKFWPIMGAGYHTIHHTTYRHNYGHYTVLMDWVFGTLRDPSLNHDEPIKVK